MRAPHASARTAILLVTILSASPACVALPGALLHLPHARFAPDLNTPRSTRDRGVACGRAVRRSQRPPPRASTCPVLITARDSFPPPLVAAAAAEVDWKPLPVPLPITTARAVSLTPGATRTARRLRRYRLPTWRRPPRRRRRRCRAAQTSSAARTSHRSSVTHTQQTHE